MRVAGKESGDERSGRELCRQHENGDRTTHSPPLSCGSNAGPERLTGRSFYLRAISVSGLFVCLLLKPTSDNDKISRTISLDSTRSRTGAPTGRSRYHIPHHLSPPFHRKPGVCVSGKKLLLPQSSLDFVLTVSPLWPSSTVPCLDPENSPPTGLPSRIATVPEPVSTHRSLTLSSEFTGNPVCASRSVYTPHRIENLFSGHHFHRKPGVSQALAND